MIDPSNGIMYYPKLSLPIMTHQIEVMGKTPFQIAYGMHPRGICELRNLGNLEHRSADGEDFATTMSELRASKEEITRHKLQV